MVHTRKSFGTVKASPPIEEKMTGKVKKSVKIQVVRDLKVQKLYKVTGMKPALSFDSKFKILHIEFILNCY